MLLVLIPLNCRGSQLTWVAVSGAGLFFLIFSFPSVYYFRETLALSLCLSRSLPTLARKPKKQQLVANPAGAGPPPRRAPVAPRCGRRWQDAPPPGAQGRAGRGARADTPRSRRPDTPRPPPAPPRPSPASGPQRPPRLAGPAQPPREGGGGAARPRPPPCPQPRHSRAAPAAVRPPAAVSEGPAPCR